MTWRVFVGLWDDGEPDWASTDRTFPDWSAAHRFLLSRMSPLVDDECSDCAASAAEQLPSLANLTTDTEWSGAVDGCDYLLMRQGDDGSMR